MIVATILCHNIFANERKDLFWQTYDSLQQPHVRVIPVDNGSSDGTQDLVRDLGGYCSTSSNTTCGHGTNIAARVALGVQGADVCVLSDDDMSWSDGWQERLFDWWEAAPAEIVLAGCHLEPEFPWNQILGKVSHGNQPALLRASTGAASWSFRPADWPKIGPIPDRIQGHGDVPACQQIIAAGYQIAQLDLAVHQGSGRSTWGNQTEAKFGWDVEPVRKQMGYV